MKGIFSGIWQDETEIFFSGGFFMEEQIRFSNDENEILAGTVHLPASPSGRGVVLAHCFTCSRHTTILRQLGQALAEAGYLALRFDFSGNGQSQGRFEETTFDKQIREVKRAMAVMAGRGVSWIGLAGHSMGAEVALLAASKTPAVKGVCAMAGRLSGLKPTHFLTPGQMKHLREKGSVSFLSRGRKLRLDHAFFSDAKQYDLAALLRSFDRPLMIVHGEADEIIPVADAHQARALNRRQAELLTLPGADHMFSRPEDRLRAVPAIVEWFDKIQ